MKTVVFDLDGTLCDITHRVHLVQGKKKDFDAFHKACVFDAPKPDIIHLLHVLSKDHFIQIVSGRSDVVFDETVKWLSDNKIYFNKITMRKAGDYTPDDKLKMSWLHKGELGEKENILFCVDDRQRVVDMWRKEGLTCLQVDQWEETK